MDGILLFDKPKTWTSHDAVDFVRRCVRQRAVGHAGTLDPIATGLLILLLGKATKRSAELMGLGKEYEGAMTLGVRTDTLDADGQVLSTQSCEGASEQDLKKIFKSLTGKILQTPPAFSAIKKDGKKMYELARAGTPVIPEAREVLVEEFSLLGFERPLAYFRVRCSKGTYVRSLCESVGQQLGFGAMLSELKRTKIGSFRLEGAQTREALLGANLEQIQRFLLKA